MWQSLRSTGLARAAAWFGLCAAVVTWPAVGWAPAAPAEPDPPSRRPQPVEPLIKYGPALCHTVTLVLPGDKDANTWPGAVTRGLTVFLHNEWSLCYDTERAAPAALWRGWLNIDDTHLTNFKGSLPPRPGERPRYENLTVPGWQAPNGQPLPIEFKGHYFHGGQTILTWRVGGREVLERPTWLPELGMLVRTVEVGPGEQPLSLLVNAGRGASAAEVIANEAPSGGPEKKGPAHQPFNATPQEPLRFALAGALAGRTPRPDAAGNAWCDFPAAKEVQRAGVAWHLGESGAVAARQSLFENQPLDPLAALTQGGPLCWPQAQVTRGNMAKATAAYVLDNLAVPLANDFQSWMRLSGLDFFADGRAAVCTLSGDVWLVSFTDDDSLAAVSWKRFATGLYEPLGLKVVAGQVYVRGRDRITRLHDLNADGEADFYENFHTSGPVGPGYHAFLFDLARDTAGNFYFASSGRKAPTQGEIVRVSPDGKSHAVVATGLRHANGLGLGGPREWLTVCDNPDGKFPAGALLVTPGAQLGFNAPRTVPYLYHVPPSIDTSAGQQVWTDAKRWGPLSGALIHTSFSRSNISYVLVHESQPFPSGFVVPLPFAFHSGCMRGAVNPRDGQLYIACQRGWDSNATIDGVLARVRYTGQPAYLVTAAAAVPEGIRLTFSCPLDRATVDFENFAAERYGNAKVEVEIDDVVPLDERTVLVKIAGLDPAATVERPKLKQNPPAPTTYRVLDPLGITFQIKAADGTAIHDTVYATVNGF